MTQQCSTTPPNRRAALALMAVLAVTSGGIFLATGAAADASDVSDGIVVRIAPAGDVTIAPTTSPAVIGDAVVLERGGNQTTR